MKRRSGLVSRSSGRTHPDTLQSQSNLAQAYLTVGRSAEAEPLLRECLAVREKTQPDDWRTFRPAASSGAA